jgi:hypothetical protein
MKKTGKLFAWLLTTVLIINIIVLPTFAALAKIDGIETGAGTEADPYVIETAEQLMYLAEAVNAGNRFSGVCFILGADIDLSAYGEGWNSGDGWVPIGAATVLFSGTFDGNGRKITGLYVRNTAAINNTTMNYYPTGLFGNVDGVIKNLTVEGADITGADATGGIAGYAYSGTAITGCGISGEIAGTGSVGGILGLTNGSVRIADCRSSANVTGSAPKIGGIAGSFEGDMSGCTATGNISGSNNAGGIAGMSSGAIDSCEASGVVSSPLTAAGIVGWLNKSGSVTNCRAMNPRVMGTAYTHRVVGDTIGTTGAVMSNNYAYYGLTDINGLTTSWTNKTHDGKDGEDTGGDEASYISDNNITVTKTVAPDIGTALDANKISVSGAAYNAAPNGTVEIRFRNATGTADVDEALYDVKSMVALDISLLLNGVPQSGGDLAVPVTITMPIPSGINWADFRILHYHGGAPDIIKPSVNPNGTCTFTVKRFSDFVFVNLLSNFGPNPATGLLDITAATAAMYTFLLMSAVLWGCVLYKRSKGNGK